MDANKAKLIASKHKEKEAGKIYRFFEKLKEKRKYKKRYKYYMNKIKHSALQGECEVFLPSMLFRRFDEYDKMVIFKLRIMGYKVDLIDFQGDFEKMMQIKIAWE